MLFRSGGGTHCDNRDEKGKCLGHKDNNDKYGETIHADNGVVQGRFPANLVHDGSDEVVRLFPNDSQRFFYCAKVSKFERNKGLDGFEEKTASEMCEDRELGSVGLNNPRAGAGRTGGGKNHHPTVKPVSLMRYLCKLITPKNGTVLDPFMGSGSTGIGAKLEGFDFIGIEQQKDYIDIATARITNY